MKKFKLFMITLATAIISNNVSSQENNHLDNPLLSNWTTKYQTPPFDLIKNEHYLPAFRIAIEEAKEEIRLIKQNKSEATFENTIEALDRSGMKLSRISGVFFNLTYCHATEELQKISYDIIPLITNYSNDINLDKELFYRVKSVYDKKSKLKLNAEQKTLLEKTYKGFVRSGANLDETQKAEYREITTKLSEISLKYKDNLLKETNSFLLLITKKEDLSGLPEGIIEMAAITAKEKGKEGWVFDLSGPSYGAFMKYSDKRDLRKQMYFAYNSRCFKGDEFDNTKIIIQMTELRLRIANLLGYNSYADYVLEERMAKSSVQVIKFLDDLVSASLPAAKKEVTELQEFAKNNGLSEQLQRWDWGYYSEKLKNQKFKISDELLKPYFKLENVIDGVFLLATKLYGLKFQETKNIPIYHTDVKTYEVFDTKKNFVAILYLDFFPRETKGGGAWCTSFREQYKIGKTDNRPQVQIVCNFTKPTPEKPSLLTFEEVTTFLHEFGHSLHAMLSNVTYSSLSGTSVYRDFVELPSQILENYAVEKQFLDLFAKHYQTNELIPADLIKKIKDYNNFQSGYFSMRQIALAKTDMAWHSITKPVSISVNDFERNALETSELLPLAEGVNISVSFSHIFDGGYSAGYYSYKWAEVLDADAYSFFKKNGIFNKKTAESFKQNILSKGGSEHPMSLYVRFRGKEPSIDALLIRSGLKK